MAVHVGGRGPGHKARIQAAGSSTVTRQRVIMSGPTPIYMNETSATRQAIVGSTYVNEKAT